MADQANGGPGKWRTRQRANKAIYIYIIKLYSVPHNITNLNLLQVNHKIFTEISHLPWSIVQLPRLDETFSQSFKTWIMW